MALIWLAVPLLALSWSFLTPLWGAADPATGAFLIFLAGLLQLLGIAAAARPTTPRGLGAAVHAAFALLAIQLAAGLALQPLLARLGSRVHLLAPLTRPLAWLVGLFGLPASADPGEGLLGVANEQHRLTFAVGAEHLGLPTLLLVLVAAAPILAFTRARAAAWALLAAAIGTYAAVRFVVLVYLYANVQKPAELPRGGPVVLFYDQRLILLSFLPLGAVLAWSLRRSVAPARLTELRLFALPHLRPAALATAGAFLVTAGLLFVEPGSRKPGRILIDDAHSGSWEPTTARLDTKSYGATPVYSFTSLRAWLALRYPRVEVHERGLLTAARLEKVDVLILKTLTRPLAGVEMRAIEEFVRRGGGLWLIGDHTNLLGMSTYTNALSERFGLRFRYDAANALSTGYFGEVAPLALASHPVMQRVPWLQLLTSATLELEPRVEPVMIVPDLLSDPIDYSKPSFFGDIEPDPGDLFGTFAIAAATRHGKGRVLAFADSTVLSSFAIFKDGHIDFAAAAVDYLNRRNVLGPWPNRVLLVVGGLLLVLGLVRIAGGPPRAAVPALLVTLGVGAGGAAAAVHSFHLATYPEVPAHSEHPRVAFLQGSGFHIAPDISRILVPPGNEYSTFFVAFQRLGVFPRQARSTDGLAAEDAVVVINPQPELDATSVRAIERYVRAGGKLLLLLPPRPPAPAADRLLSAFGLRYTAKRPAPPLALPRSALAEGVVAPAPPRVATRFPAARPVPLSADLPLEIAVREHGVGRVVVVLGAGFFSRAEMGHVMEEPSKEQARRYAVEYFIVHDLLGFGDPAGAPVSSTEPRQTARLETKPK